VVEPANGQNETRIIMFSAVVPADIVRSPWLEVEDMQPKLTRISRIAALLVIGFAGAVAPAQTSKLTHNSNLRKAASSSSAILQKLSTGAEVTLLSTAKKSGYYHVQVQGGVAGWVLARNVDVSIITGSSPTGPSSSLLTKLHGAQVAAVPQPLIIGGQQVCKATGKTTDPKMIALNTQKNRTDMPDVGAYIAIDFDVLKALPRDSPDQLEGAPVMVEGFLSNKINVENKSPGESTNCNLLGADEVDWHIYLTKSPKQLIKTAIIVETTPRTRPLHHWDKSVLDGLVNQDTRVRISGWLMYDFQHTGVIGKERATVWEVHPITRIEAADANGGWKDIEH